METYYDPQDLKQFSADGIGAFAKDAWEGFMGYYAPVYNDGALTAREKHLIALGVAAALQCPYCIDAHGSNLLENGTTSDQIMEVFHVAASLRAGATLAHATQALHLIEDNEL